MAISLNEYIFLIKNLPTLFVICWKEFFVKKSLTEKQLVGSSYRMAQKQKVWPKFPNEQKNFYFFQKMDYIP